MTPELNKNEVLPGAEPDATKRPRGGVAEQPETTEPEETRTVFGSLRDAYERARDGRKRVQPEKQSRTAKSVDRSKGLLLLAVAVIVMIFVFLGMFSSSSRIFWTPRRKRSPSASDSPYRWEGRRYISSHKP